MTHCNCYSQKRQIMKVFEQYLQLRIKFVLFAHIPITTCPIWRGMCVKIIWIWRTAIVIAKTDQKWCFLWIISALKKNFVFVTYRPPIMLILKRYECLSHLDLTHCNCYSQKRQIMMVFEQYLQLRIQFVCFAHIPIPTCSFWRRLSVKVICIWHTAIVTARNDK